jgi:hypothetical protein
VRSLAEALPWFLPGLAVSLALGLVLAPPLARALGATRAVAYLLIVSLGAVVSATLLPTAGGFDWAAAGVGGCEVHRAWLAPLGHYLRPTEESLNVLLFVPLGIALALLPRSARTAAVIATAVAMPALVETTQMLLPVLGRGCEVGDVVNNSIGLVLGLVVGLGAGRIGTAARTFGTAGPPGRHAPDDAGDRMP